MSKLHVICPIWHWKHHNKYDCTMDITANKKLSLIIRGGLIYNPHWLILVSLSSSKQKLKAFTRRTFWCWKDYWKRLLSLNQWQRTASPPPLSTIMSLFIQTIMSERGQSWPGCSITNHTNVNTSCKSYSGRMFMSNMGHYLFMSFVFGYIHSVVIDHELIGSLSHQASCPQRK